MKKRLSKGKEQARVGLTQNANTYHIVFGYFHYGLDLRGTKVFHIQILVSIGLVSR